MAVTSLKIVRFGNFPYATLHGGCLCYSSMLSGYASEVAVMYWIDWRAIGDNKHVWYSIPFLIGAVFLPITIFWYGPIAAYGKGCSGETGG